MNIAAIMLFIAMFAGSSMTAVMLARGERQAHSSGVGVCRAGWGAL